LTAPGGDVTATTNDDAGGNRYTLIGQTYFRPTELRFHEVALRQSQRIAFLPAIRRFVSLCSKPYSKHEYGIDSH